jgi:glycosyltransferase involved in cell wall biosynthesis
MAAGVLLVVPTYNERATLPAVVAGVLETGEDVDVLVVDDASPDGTGDIAEDLATASSRVRVMHRPAKEGLGTAYRAGFAWGLARGYEAFGEMDADRSHDPAALPMLLRALRGADVVIGSRYVPHGGVVDWPLPRVMLSRNGNRYVHWCTGMPVADATSGYRLYRRPVLEAVDIDSVRSEGYSFQVEMALRAWRAGFRVVEVPIIFTERREGASKISRVIVAEALLRVAQWGATGPRRPAGVHPESVVASGR